MSVPRHTVSGWLRLFATLLAAVGLLARIAAPLPAEASAPRSDLTALGAVLCHSDDGSSDQAPADPGTCDHCPLCGVAHAAVFVPPSVAAAVPTPSVAGPLQPHRVNIAARPRAPPERAHPPTGPPTV
jgi:hypothetical protein